MRLEFEAGGEGLAGLRVRGLEDGPIDGLAFHASDGPAGSGAHPLGAVAVDHVVARTPDLERTLGALQDAGLELRRTRDAGPDARQGFFNLGTAILEVAGPREPQGDGPASFWGVVLVVEDLDAAAARLGDVAGTPRDAVQPGRRILTIRREAGLSTAVALMTPRSRG